jgi:hypothetical protein
VQSNRIFSKSHVSRTTSNNTDSSIRFEMNYGGYMKKST